MPKGQQLSSVKKRMRNIKLCFFVPLLFISEFTLSSQSQVNIQEGKTLKSDTTPVRSRTFPYERIREFKKDSDFNYGPATQLKLNLLQRLLQWILRQFSNYADVPGSQPWLKTLFYIIIGAIIAYAILKVAGADISKAFYKLSDRGNLEFDVVEEDIHQMDFEALIEEAINQKDYKKAIRLYYLYALKKLADRDLIQWKPGKTNHEYEQELASPEIKPSFEDLSYYFDYAWYGDFPVSQHMFNRVKVIFKDFKAIIDTQ